MRQRDSFPLAGPRQRSLVATRRARLRRDRLCALCVAPWLSLPLPRHTSHDGGAAAGTSPRGGFMNYRLALAVLYVLLMAAVAAVLLYRLNPAVTTAI